MSKCGRGARRAGRLLSSAEMDGGSDKDQEKGSEGEQQGRCALRLPELAQAHYGLILPQLLCAASI